MTDETPAVQRPPVKILVVEDDRALCKMMATALSSSGFTTFTANTGEDGLAVFQAQQPDVVLLDVALPGITGFDVAAEIRRTESPEKHTILVIVTAYSQSFLVSTDFQTGIDSYLTKPVLPEDLINHINLLTAS